MNWTAPISIRRIRLATGLVLFAFVTLHLSNLVVGLYGLEAMTAVGDFSGKIWGSPPGLLFLYGSLAIHLALALRSLYRRRRLKMPVGEAAQVVLGLSIPLLLATHVVAIRGGAETLGVDYDYRLLQTYFWGGDGTVAAVKQVIGLIAAWVHGCIGVYFWLRIKPFFERWRPLLFATATAVPLLALAGFVAAGREAQLRMATDPGWVDHAMKPLSVVSEDGFARLASQETWFLSVFLAAIVLVIAARYWRLRSERKAGQFSLDYIGGKRVVAPTGLTILDISRLNDIPHASVCGGRGRCSTCRVRLEGEEGAVPPPAPEEIRVLQRIKAPDGVRLACQTRPQGNLKVTLLLPPGTDASGVRRGTVFRQGEERALVVLFADLHGFTTLSESKLPYDVVFLLNRLAREWGEAIEGVGGRIDKFMGDGVMALFGLEQDPGEGARQALAAAREIDQRLQTVNASLAADLPQPLRVGIGIHAGPVIVGEIGFGRATGVTAIGDVVNTASRLESATRTLGSTLVASEEVLSLAGLDPEGGKRHEIAVKGREAPVKVIAMDTW